MVQEAEENKENFVHPSYTHQMYLQGPPQNTGTLPSLERKAWRSLILTDCQTSFKSRILVTLLIDSESVSLRSIFGQSPD